MTDTAQPLRLQTVTTNVNVKNEAVTILIPPAETFNNKQYRWNTSEEVYAILTATSRHTEWLTHSVRQLPANGSLILYDREIDGLNYRRDGYIWKTRKDNKHTREDHMKLRVKGVDLINGHYAHSAILSSFHRRCYSLPKRSNLILVHYLNAPVEGRDSPIPTLKNCDKRVWAREELAKQIFPMYEAPLDPVARRRLNYVPPSSALVNQMIDGLLANQTNEDGVQVTAQWVLSLDNNCSYVVHAAQPRSSNTFQIPNSNVQFVLSTIDNKSVIQPAPTSNTNANIANSLVNMNNNLMPLPSPTAAEQPARQQHYVCDSMSSQPVHGPPFSSMPAQLMEQNDSGVFSSSTNQVFIPSLGTNSHQVYPAAVATPFYRPEQQMNIESQSDNYLLAPTNPTGAEIECKSTPNHSAVPHITRNVTSEHELPRTHSCVTTVTSQHEVLPPHPSLPQLHNDLEELGEQMSCLPMDISPSHNANDDASASEINAQLDLYQMTADEISSALSANMPNSCSPGNAGDLANDLQLDSNFDLFAELNVNEDMAQSVFSSSLTADDLSRGKVTLTALAPEWSYSDGGCKVLLIGPWKASGDEYTCIFGDKAVKAELVQDGVLSCITPAHLAGVVQVTVAYSGDVISESSNFEFRDRKYESSRHRSWFLCEESRLQMALVDRLEVVKCRLDILFPAPILADQMNLEQRVTALVHNIQRYKWRSKEPLPKTSYKGLTLFHLAAALGYRTLLDSLKNWREECPCEILAHEVSTRTPDSHGSTAMHWACALGRMETTLVMYYMDRLSLDDVNKDGMTPLSLARAFRNKHIVEMLVQQEHTVLESKLDHQGLNKYTVTKASPTKHRRSASPARRSSPVRHPPVTRHNSSPTSTYLPPHVSHHLSDSGVHCSTPEHLQPPPPPFYAGEQIKISYDAQSELDDDSIVDIEAISDDESSSVIETDGELHNHRIRTLAEHIIAAIPDRIKSTASDDSSSVALLSYRERSSSRSSYSSTPSCTGDSGVCTPLTGDWVEEWNRSRMSSSPCFSADSIYRQSAVSAVQSHSSSFYLSSSYYHSTAATASAASTTSYNTGRSDSPPPSAQILGEYFNAGEGVEYGLSQLTLSDTEQRKLYQAAQVIQHAFRQFKDKKQQQREIEAAVIIQTYYRRFKEFTTLRHIQKQQAATRIQSQFRSYYAQKRFKKSRDAALLIQHHYRAYKEHEHFKRSRNAAVLIQQKFRTHYNRKKCSKQSSQDGSVMKSGTRDIASSLRTIHHYQQQLPHK